MTQAAILGEQWGGVQLGTYAIPDGGFLPPEVSRFLSSYVGTFADAWVQARAADIERAVADGMAAGDSMDGIATRVGAVFDDAMGPDRAMLIARTETIRASNAGAVDRYRQAQVEVVEWVATEGAGTCQECAATDGERARIGETFTNGVDAPPLHPDCRCCLIPQLEEYGALGGASEEPTDEEPTD